ncbi:MAG: response regulator [Candidatus Eisenbacteria bacterium]|nr:response regulator [Candidatus Eisenbacteria bacterium]
MSRILVVDDDDDLVRIFSYRLQQDGYDVSSASTGAQALEALLREPPDLVFLDLGLPRGNGFQVLEKVRATPRLSGVPVIVLSGNAEPAYRDRAVKAGADRFFPKPSDLTDLLVAARELLARATPHPG